MRNHRNSKASTESPAEESFLIKRQRKRASRPLDRKSMNANIYFFRDDKKLFLCFTLNEERKIKKKWKNHIKLINSFLHASPRSHRYPLVHNIQREPSHQRAALSFKLLRGVDDQTANDVWTIIKWMMSWCNKVASFLARRTRWSRECHFDTLNRSIS